MRPTRRTIVAGAALAASPALAAERPRVEARFQLTQGRAWTQVWINGAGPFRFLIDTGATIFSVREDLTRSLGLMAGRDDLMHGGVAGMRTTKLYTAREVDIAHAALIPNVQFISVPPFSDAFDGLIPGGLFALGAVGLDWGRQVLVIDRDGRPPEGADYHRVPLSRVQLRDGHKLVVEARLDGAPLRLALDTGADGEVTLLGPAVARLGLWERFGAAAEQQGRGLAGGFAIRRGRAGKLSLGPIDFDAPHVDLVDPRAVSVATDFDGLIGIDLLRRMDWTVVGAQSAVFMRLNGAVAAGRYVSGLTLSPGLPIRVLAVAPGSPAARTALRAGDVIVARDAEDRRAFDELLSGARGLNIGFTATRDGGAPFNVVLKLAPAA